MEYKVDDRTLDADVFLPFVNAVWPAGADAGRVIQNHQYHRV